MKNTNDTEEAVCVIENEEDGNGAACQVRRKIEEYLERRRTIDELGEHGENKR